MGNFRITSSVNNVQYNYEDENLKVDGNYEKDIDGKLQGLHGNIYRSDENGVNGEYVGYFNGTYNGDEIRYSFSDMTRKMSNLVWDAVDEIEENVLSDKKGEEE